MKYPSSHLLGVCGIMGSFSMKIALIRGPSLNPWELQSYEPLVKEHTLEVFATPITPYWRQAATPITIHRLFWWDQLTIPWGPKATWFFNGASSRLLGCSFHMRGLEKALAPFDLYHSLETHNTYTYQCLIAKRRYKKPLVVTVWETLPHRGESHPLRKKRKQAVLKEADLFLAISQRTKDMLMTEGVRTERIQVMPMGINLDEFSNAKAAILVSPELIKRPHEFRVLSIARLVSSKGVWDLLHAAEKRIKTSPETCLQLYFVGEGPEKEAMRGWIHSKGLSERIHVLGGLPYSEIPALLKSADVLTLASQPTAIWEEQFGYVLVEAMASGIPLVSTQSGAIPEVVGDAGLLVPPFSPNDLSLALEQLEADPSLRQTLASRGLKRVKALYDREKIAQRLQTVYQTVASHA